MNAARQRLEQAVANHRRALAWAGQTLTDTDPDLLTPDLQAARTALIATHNALAKETK